MQESRLTFAFSKGIVGFNVDIAMPALTGDSEKDSEILISSLNKLIQLVGLQKNVITMNKNSITVTGDFKVTDAQKCTPKETPVQFKDLQEIANELIGFLHRHPMMETEHGIPTDHVVVDKADWELHRFEIAKLKYAIRDLKKTILEQDSISIDKVTIDKTTFEKLLPILRFYGDRNLYNLTSELKLDTTPASNHLGVVRSVVTPNGLTKDGGEAARTIHREIVESKRMVKFSEGIPKTRSRV